MSTSSNGNETTVYTYTRLLALCLFPRLDEWSVVLKCTCTACLGQLVDLVVATFLLGQEGPLGVPFLKSCVLTAFQSGSQSSAICRNTSLKVEVSAPAIVPLAGGAPVELSEGELKDLDKSYGLTAQNASGLRSLPPDLDSY